MWFIFLPYCLFQTSVTIAIGCNLALPWQLLPQFQFTIWQGASPSLVCLNCQKERPIPKESIKSNEWKLKQHSTVKTKQNKAFYIARVNWSLITVAIFFISLDLTSHHKDLCQGQWRNATVFVLHCDWYTYCELISMDKIQFNVQYSIVGPNLKMSGIAQENQCSARIGC